MVNANPCSRPEFIWRFHSLQKHCDHFAIAATEKEARSLIPDQNGVLTGRFSTSSQPNTNPWYRNITNPGIAEAH
ncbi:TPA: host cell division inhibitor Icd-like protein [Escherichia coli]|nr:host cell division inhibitor Icd-like protein [Escherichia coli]HAH4379147.1 host cell division inhibitor Icd-like protein [Escherichia coli]